MKLRNIASAVLMGLGIALVADAFSCTPANSPQISPRSLARATVETAESAWIATAKTCVSAAVAQQDENLLKTCESVLDPARDTIIAASYSVDTWTAADQKNFPCLMGSAMGAVTNAVNALKDAQVALPPIVSDFLNLASYYAPQCVTSDAGAE